MKWIALGLWFGLSVASMLLVAADFRRYAANQIGIGKCAWFILCILIGPIACFGYLSVRARWKKRMDRAVRHAIGAGYAELPVTLVRLDALFKTGLITLPIYRFYLEKLQKENEKQAVK